MSSKRRTSASGGASGTAGGAASAAAAQTSKASKVSDAEGKRKPSAGGGAKPKSAASRQPAKGSAVSPSRPLPAAATAAAEEEHKVAAKIELSSAQVPAAAQPAIAMTPPTHQNGGHGMDVSSMSLSGADFAPSVTRSSPSLGPMAPIFIPSPSTPLKVGVKDFTTADGLDSLSRLLRPSTRAATAASVAAAAAEAASMDLSIESAMADNPARGGGSGGGVASSQGFKSLVEAKLADQMQQAHLTDRLHQQSSHRDHVIQAQQAMQEATTRTMQHALTMATNCFRSTLRAHIRTLFTSIAQQIGGRATDADAEREAQEVWNKFGFGIVRCTEAWPFAGGDNDRSGTDDGDSHMEVDGKEAKGERRSKMGTGAAGMITPAQAGPAADSISWDHVERRVPNDLLQWSKAATAFLVLLSKLEDLILKRSYFEARQECSKSSAQLFAWPDSLRGLIQPILSAIPELLTGIEREAGPYMNVAPTTPVLARVQQQRREQKMGDGMGEIKRPEIKMHPSEMPAMMHTDDPFASFAPSAFAPGSGGVGGAFGASSIFGQAQSMGMELAFAPMKSSMPASPARGSGLGMPVFSASSSSSSASSSSMSELARGFAPRSVAQRDIWGAPPKSMPMDDDVVMTE